MNGGRFGEARGDVVRLFEGESVAGLGVGDLLGRFADRRDEAAFEGLVTRLGPMVLGVCRRMLVDPHDVDDAFQATFLVLVRKAGSIRDRDLVAPWLHGVATKVARRARASSARRAARERLAVVPEAVDEVASVESGWPELRAMIDEEIGRLPEDHRRAVVLCDVEGLSREEAAQRLGWSLNMIRGRLERARGRLRGRLARRGVAPTGAWAAMVVAPPTLPLSLMMSTTRAALAFSVGRTGTGLASASAVALSRGVLRMMMLSKLKVGLAVVITSGFVAAGAGFVAAQGPGDGLGASKDLATPAPDQKVEAKPAVAPPPFRPRSAAELAKARIETATQRLKMQQAFYAQGRITIDRLTDASKVLMEALRDAAGSKDQRVQAVREHHDRLQEILRLELAELEVGRATESDVAEAKSTLLDAEFALAKELEAAEAKPEVGAMAEPGGPIVSRTAQAVPIEQTRKVRSPLAEAIAVFNADASKNDQALVNDPLSEDEVIAAIRYWQPDREVANEIKGSHRSPPNIPIDAFKAIATTRRLPAGASFRLESLPRDHGGDYVYFGLFVMLSMPGQNGQNGHLFPIRERLSRASTLDEALKEAEDDLRRFPILPDRHLKARILDLKERIEASPKFSKQDPTRQ